jgi:curved DNA-binding protein
MADRTDPYKILQVDPEADPDVIQAAYRRLAQKYHPDVATDGEAASRMVAINEAWQILRDPQRRAAHDEARERTRAGLAAEGRAADGRAADRRATHGGSGAAAASSASSGVGPAGPPPGNPSGSVLNFGRYAGWSLGEIARRDLEFVEWLDRMPIGRPYRDEIDAILRRAGRRRSEAEESGERRGLFRRR